MGKKNGKLTYLDTLYGAVPGQAGEIIYIPSEEKKKSAKTKMAIGALIGAGIGAAGGAPLVSSLAPKKDKKYAIGGGIGGALYGAAMGANIGAFENYIKDKDRKKAIYDYYEDYYRDYDNNKTASEELDSMYKQAFMGPTGDATMLGVTIGDLTKKYNKAAGGMTGMARQKAGWNAVAGGIGKSVAKGAILGAGAQVAANAIDNITKPTQEDEYGRRVVASEVLDEMWKEAGVITELGMERRKKRAIKKYQSILDKAPTDYLNSPYKQHIGSGIYATWPSRKSFIESHISGIKEGRVSEDEWLKYIGRK